MSFVHHITMWYNIFGGRKMSKNTTLHNISPEMILKLKEISSVITGSLSVSALIRHIAKYGKIKNGQLIVEGWSSVESNE